MWCRCLQTASFAAEGLGIQPQDWTVTCAVGEVRYCSCSTCIIPACHRFGGAACSTSQFKSLLLSLSIMSEASCIKGHHTAKISTGCLGWVHAHMYQTPVAGMLKSVVCIFSAMTWSYASTRTFAAMISSNYCMHPAL